MKIRFHGGLLFTSESGTQKKNSMARVHKQTIPSKQPPLVREVNANVCEQRGVA
jgi:hypothetical protein